MLGGLDEMCNLGKPDPWFYYYYYSCVNILDKFREGLIVYMAFMYYMPRLKNLAELL